MSLRADIEAIYRQAIARVDAGDAVRRSLRREDDTLVLSDGTSLPIPASGVHAIAIGKASPPMLAALAEQLGERFAGGIAVAKAPAGAPPRCEVLVGAHPVPDERSLAAGEAVLDFAAAVPAGGLVCCLISGGGSALVEALRPGVTLAELRSLTGELLRAGASIHELNAVRARLSRLKGGGLLAALAHARVVNLIVSDVLGDDPTVIASGPSVPRRAGLDADDVLERFGIAATVGDIPHERRTAVDDPVTLAVASLALAIDAAADAAQSLGYQPLVLARSLDGEAREVGRMVASIVVDATSGAGLLPPGGCLIAGGETVVTVRGNGTGGRNTEAALAAALRLSGTAGVAVGFLATDGDDGTTGAAGAIVDGATLAADELRDAREALARNDSYPLLARAGAALRTGPSGTNVNDLIVALREREG